MWRWKCCCYFNFYVICLQILGVVIIVTATTNGNSADDIVEIINHNRTSGKLSKLFNSPGLGCMALQYISRCTGNCTTNNTLNCHPPEVDITEIYAPNCGVELPTVDIITGHLIACNWKNLDPKEAFSTALMRDKKAVSLLHSKEHTEIGVGLIREHKGAFFWCVLFSSGNKNSTFVLEGGKGIEQKTGCFSGTNLPCSSATKISTAVVLFVFTFAVLVYLTTANFVF